MHRLRPVTRRLLGAASLAGLSSVATAASAWAAPWPLDPSSPTSRAISELFWLTLIIAAIVFLLVEGLLIFSSLRFRRRSPHPTQEPPQIHGNTRLEVMWAIVPALILIGLYGMSVRTLGVLNDTPSSGVHVQVTAQQFQWNFSYTDSGVQTVNDLHIPAGVPIIFDVTSKDVIHSFWVPELHGKIDANPGRVNHIWFQADKLGEYRGACAELCGPGHAGMLFTVTAVSQSDFDQWLQSQKSGGATAASGQVAGGAAAADAGKQLIAQKGCGSCHMIPGVSGAVGTVGPNLGGVAGRTKIAGGAVSNAGPDDLKKWIVDPPSLKPGTAMPKLGLTDDEATKIVAYLETLK